MFLHQILLEQLSEHTVHLVRKYVRTFRATYTAWMDRHRPISDFLDRDDFLRSNDPQRSHRILIPHIIT